MNGSMIVTGNQFRSARALLDEELGECSARANIPVSTLWRLESAGMKMPQALTSTLSKLIEHFERAGIRFINDGERVGVVLRRRCRGGTGMRDVRALRRSSSIVTGPSESCFPADAGSADKWAGS